MRTVITVNMNESVEVELSEYGEEIYKDYYTGAFDAYKKMASATGEVKEHIDSHPKDPTGHRKFLLWELFTIFGYSFYVGNTKVPFEENLLQFESKEKL